MKLRLRSIAGPLNDQVIELDQSSVYVFGREPDKDGVAPITLDSKTVSRQHCQILYHSEDGFLIKDMNSSNGIRVNRRRVYEVPLKHNDVLQIGEYSFRVESIGEGDVALDTSSVKAEGPAAGATEKYDDSIVTGASKDRKSQLKSLTIKYWNRFEKLDLKIRALVLLLLATFVIHSIIFTPMLSDARFALLERAFETGRSLVNALAEKNRRELAEGTTGLLDCNILKSEDGVLEKFILDSRGKVLCPARGDMAFDRLSEVAMERNEALDSCRSDILFGNEVACDLVAPITEWDKNTNQYATIGAARIRYIPRASFDGLQNLQSLRWKTLLLAMLVILGVWWLLNRWIVRGLEITAENIHLVASGTAQTLENPESFAALHPLISEINRVISQRNQGVTRSASDQASEASFLQSILQQVLLLEERPVMIVDRENQIIAASTSLSSIVPVDVAEMNRHITESVADHHLQGDLMSLLNDLNGSNEVIDRALSTSDRVFQVRGLPLYLREEYVAAVLMF